MLQHCQHVHNIILHPTKHELTLERITPAPLIHWAKGASEIQYALPGQRMPLAAQPRFPPGISGIGDTQGLGLDSQSVRHCHLHLLRDPCDVMIIPVRGLRTLCNIWRCLVFLAPRLCLVLGEFTRVLPDAAMSNVFNFYYYCHGFSKPVVDVSLCATFK